eukprot:GHVL01011802.1.p1 GENE.GHVL01011802.1~~GHVL01011802.1.p1  ORF type:complete len:314 (+),score=94.51 GHVL01011802.1:58-999(+)
MTNFNVLYRDRFETTILPRVKVPLICKKDDSTTVSNNTISDVLDNVTDKDRFQKDILIEDCPETDNITVETDETIEQKTDEDRENFWQQLVKRIYRLFVAPNQTRILLALISLPNEDFVIIKTFIIDLINYLTYNPSPAVTDSLTDDKDNETAIDGYETETVNNILLPPPDLPPPLIGFPTTCNRMKLLDILLEESVNPRSIDPLKFPPKNVINRLTSILLNTENLKTDDISENKIDKYPTFKIILFLLRTLYLHYFTENGYTNLKKTNNTLVKKSNDKNPKQPNEIKPPGVLLNFLISLFTSQGTFYIYLII